MSQAGSVSLMSMVRTKTDCKVCKMLRNTWWGSLVPCLVFPFAVLWAWGYASIGRSPGQYAHVPSVHQLLSVLSTKVLSGPANRVWFLICGSVFVLRQGTSCYKEKWGTGRHSVQHVISLLWFCLLGWAIFGDEESFSLLGWAIFGDE